MPCGEEYYRIRHAILHTPVFDIPVIMYLVLIHVQIQYTDASHIYGFMDKYVAYMKDTRIRTWYTDT